MTVLADIFVHSRTSTATYVDNAGVIQTATTGTPRVGNHVWESGAWVNKGYLHESAAATNLITTPATITDTTRTPTVTAAEHTLHFSGTGTVTLTGASTAGPLVGVGTGEQNRVSLTFTPTAGTLTLTVTGTVSNAQLELGPIATSYIVGTRAADVLTLPSGSIPYPSGSPLAVSLAISGVVNSTNNTFINWEADASNYIRIESGTSDFTFSQAESSTVDSVTGGFYQAGANFSFASRNGATFVNGAWNGDELTADTTPLVFPSLSSNDMLICSDFNGTISKFRMWGSTTGDIGDLGIAEASYVAGGIPLAIDIGTDSTLEVTGYVVDGDLTMAVTVTGAGAPTHFTDTYVVTAAQLTALAAGTPLALVAPLRKDTTNPIIEGSNLEWWPALYIYDPDAGAVTETFSITRDATPIDGALDFTYTTVAADSDTTLVAIQTVAQTASINSPSLPVVVPAFAAGGAVVSVNTGGTKTVDGAFDVYTFTGDGSLTFSAGGDIDYLAVAGGGGGGEQHSGGGGGGGGLLSGSYTVTASAYTITVGAGGAANTNGGNSSITGTNAPTAALGGGAGSTEGSAAGDGGSGGGGAGGSGIILGGSGTAGQGNDGGDGGGASYGTGGGGGGAGFVGTNGTNGGGVGHAGGDGLQNSITGSAVYYAGGGGSGAWDDAAGTAGGAGGLGGGGAGGESLELPTAGTNGLGGGGGGSQASNSGLRTGAVGGSGVVIIKVPTP